MRTPHEPTTKHDTTTNPITAARALALALLTATLSSGCTFLTGAAAGATGGYVAAEEGVEVRSPVEVDESEDEDDED